MKVAEVPSHLKKVSKRKFLKEYVFNEKVEIKLSQLFMLHL